jgi:hypothetical protein
MDANDRRARRMARLKRDGYSRWWTCGWCDGLSGGRDRPAIEAVPAWVQGAQQPMPVHVLPDEGYGEELRRRCLLGELGMFVPESEFRDSPWLGATSAAVMLCPVCACHLHDVRAGLVQIVAVNSGYVMVDGEWRQQVRVRGVA